MTTACTNTQPGSSQQQEVKKPICTKANIKTISFHAASDTKNDKWQKMTEGGRDFYYQPTPAFTSNEIESLVLVSEEDTKPYLRGKLTEKGKALLAETTEALAKQGGYLLIQRQDEVVSIPKVQAKITSGVVALMSYNDLKWTDYCSN